MELVFPILAELPEELSSHLQRMIDCLKNMDLSVKPASHKGHPHILEVCDSSNRLKYLFKKYSDEEEEAARKEVAVYLLDHPPNSYRAVSPTIYGFCGVRPTVMVNFTCASERMMGILMEYVEDSCLVHQTPPQPRSNLEVQKLSLIDIRFGNLDRNSDNILFRVEDGSTRLIPIDHELSLSNEVQPYNCCGFAWLDSKEYGDPDAAFHSECVDYVNQLDVNADLGFLRQCGWEVDASYAERLSIFTMFLKKSVSHGLTAYHIGNIASYRCANVKDNLQDIVERVGEEGNLLEKVGNRIDKRLKKYVRNNVPARTG